MQTTAAGHHSTTDATGAHRAGRPRTDGLPLWLRTAIGLGYAAVGAAHLIVGVLIGAAEKGMVLAAVLVVLLVNLYSLDIGRARLTAWWERQTDEQTRIDRR